MLEAAEAADPTEPCRSVHGGAYTRKLASSCRPAPHTIDTGYGAALASVIPCQAAAATRTCGVMSMGDSPLRTEAPAPEAGAPPPSPPPNCRRYVVPSMGVSAMGEKGGTEPGVAAGAPPPGAVPAPAAAAPVPVGASALAPLVPTLLLVAPRRAVAELVLGRLPRGVPSPTGWPPAQATTCWLKYTT